MRRRSPNQLLDRVGGFWHDAILVNESVSSPAVLTSHRLTKRLISAGTRPWGLEHLAQPFCSALHHMASTE